MINEMNEGIRTMFNIIYEVLMQNSLIKGEVYEEEKKNKALIQCIPIFEKMEKLWINTEKNLRHRVKKIVTLLSIDAHDKPCRILPFTCKIRSFTKHRNQPLGT